MSVDARTRQLQAGSSAIIAAQHVEPSTDMKAERARATFDVAELTHFTAGGRRAHERKMELSAFLERQPWADKSQRYFLTTEEEKVYCTNASVKLWDLVVNGDGSFSQSDGIKMRAILDAPGGLELHLGMWLPALLASASDEQREKWMAPSAELEVIGTYAQTELGHGTFLRGLETTATYDKETETFVLHSPTVSATKWWPGTLGKTATHAATMARMIIDAKDYGPNMFVVQVRDLETHLPMPGITVGDIGPKFGYNGVDNGFMQFDHVRIPRTALMSRFANVAPDGTYTPPPPSNSKASYATMMYVRATIIEGAGHYLSKAATIATRYCAVRRQTASGTGQRETQVLDYQNSAGTLLPIVAQAYALHFMGQEMMARYRKFEADRDAGDFSHLPELHALSSGLKAITTWITADEMEICRRSCGGHGYSLLSGLPTLLASYVQNVTWEGDNNVLCLQTARYLLKAAMGATAGKPLASSVAYLAAGVAGTSARCQAVDPIDWLSADVQLTAMRAASVKAIARALATVQRNGHGRIAFDGNAWNSSSMDLIQAAKLHCRMYLVENFVRVVDSQRSSLSSATIAVLDQMRALTALTLIEKDLSDHVVSGHVSTAQAEMVRVAQAQLWAALRPNAVSLVDAFGHTDYSLNSALGRADGDVYRALLDMAKGSPLNATEEGPTWEQVLKPRMLARKGGSHRAGAEARVSAVSKL